MNYSVSIDVANEGEVIGGRAKENLAAVSRGVSTNYLGQKSRLAFIGIKSERNLAVGIGFIVKLELGYDKEGSRLDNSACREDIFQEIT
jgi:hypothetical protein